MKKFIKSFIIALVTLSLFSTFAMADERVVLLETHAGEENPELFVKGISGGVSDVSGVVGNTECPDVDVTGLTDGNICLDTLILIDNSLSVPQERLDEFKDIIIQMVGDRKDGMERFSVTTYSEDISDIPDFGSDYQAISQMVNSIERKNQDTRLTDAITKIVKSGILNDNGECSYKRLLIFSDGVDDQGGYSKNERDALLKESNVPIYTVGVYNKNSSNEQELADFFSLSRETGAAYFLLSNKSADKIKVLIDSDECYQIKDSSEWASLANVLGEDREIIRFTVQLADDVKDGSNKTVTVKFNANGSEHKVQADNIRMPQMIIEKKEEPKETVAPVTEEKQEETPPEEEPKQSFWEHYRKLIYIAGIALGIIIILVIVIVVVIKKAKEKSDNDIITETPNSIGDASPFAEEEEKTVLINSPWANDTTEGDTVLINQTRNYMITLTDLDAPARMVSKPINDELIVGKSVSKADLVINYDKSISGAHCSIIRNGEKFYVKDLESTNGTFLNDNRVLSSKVEICSGNVLLIGRTRLKIDIS